MSRSDEIETLTAVVAALAEASKAAVLLGEDAWPLRRSIVAVSRDALSRKAVLLRFESEVEA